jgi:hypothetical protein
MSQMSLTQVATELEYRPISISSHFYNSKSLLIYYYMAPLIIQYQID